MRQVGDFPWEFRFPPPIKSDHHLRRHHIYSWIADNGAKTGSRATPKHKTHKVKTKHNRKYMAMLDG